MKKSNLLRELVSPHGSMLIPHINAYQMRGQFPDTWEIEIPNKKPEREHGEAKIRFSASEDSLISEEALFRKFSEDTPKEPISAELRRIFDCGTFWHGYLQNILVDMGFIHPDGVEKYIIKKIERPEGVAYGSGLGDLVGVEIPSNGKWLVDIKTMNVVAFANPPSYLMDKYTAQIRLYGDWFGYDKLMILAVNKNGGDLKEIQITPDPVFIEEVYQKWITVTDRLEGCVIR